MSKKILIDARLYGLEHAGLGRYTMNLIENLKKLDKKNNYVIILRKKYFDRLKFPKNWKTRKVELRHYSLKEQLMLPKIIYQEKPDVFHVPHFNVPIFYFGNMVVTIHDMLMHKVKGVETTTLPLPFYQLKRFGYKIIFKKAVEGSKKIIVPSSTVKKEVVSEYKIDSAKINVIYEGVDKSKFRSVNSKRVNTVLSEFNINQHEYFIYSGNAYPHKNLVKAIKAIVLLNKNYNRKILFVITSSRNVFTDRLNKKIKSMGASDYVQLLGFISDEKLNILLKQSIAFLYPSLSEGFGLQGLEAISAGTLVVGSDITVFKEIYKDNIYYFDPNNVNSMVKTMERVINIPIKKRNEKIQKAISFIKKYSWSKMARETIEVYESCDSI